jgi:hypothetical protein
VGENFRVIANFIFPSKKEKLLPQRTLKIRRGREGGSVHCDRCATFASSAAKYC